MMAEILKIGVPTLVFQLLTSLSIALINRAASDYGDSVIAGMGAVTRITSMGTLVVFGFLKGFQPIAGFSYGAKKFDRLREAIKTSIIWSTSFCLVVGLVMAAFSTQIISQFTEGDVQMILAGQKSLFANGLTFIFSVSTRYTPLYFLLWARERQVSFWDHADKVSALFLSFAAAYGMGNERNPICPTHCRYNFRSNHAVYGNTSS